MNPRNMPPLMVRKASSKVRTSNISRPLAKTKTTQKEYLQEARAAQLSSYEAHSNNHNRNTTLTNISNLHAETMKAKDKLQKKKVEEHSRRPSSSTHQALLEKKQAHAHHKDTQLHNNDTRPLLQSSNSGVNFSSVQNIKTGSVLHRENLPWNIHVDQTRFVSINVKY